MALGLTELIKKRSMFDFSSTPSLPIAKRVSKLLRQVSQIEFDGVDEQHLALEIENLVFEVILLDQSISSNEFAEPLEYDMIRTLYNLVKRFKGNDRVLTMGKVEQMITFLFNTFKKLNSLKNRSCKLLIISLKALIELFS